MATLVVADRPQAGRDQRRDDLVPHAQVEAVAVEEHDRFALALDDGVQRHPVTIDDHRAVLKVKLTGAVKSWPARSSTASLASVTWNVSPGARSTAGCHTTHQFSAS